MRKQIVVVCLGAAFMTSAAFAADEQVAAEDAKQARLAVLDEMVITADKAQPADYKPDAKVAALLAEIDEE